MGLKAGGILKSRRGQAGGHALSVLAEDVKLARILRLMEDLEGSSGHQMVRRPAWRGAAVAEGSELRHGTRALV